MVLLNSEVCHLTTYLCLLYAIQVILPFRSSCSPENLEAFEMELVGSGERFEKELGLPETSNVCPENPTRDYLGPVGVRFSEKGDPSFLTDPYVSSWVKVKLGTVTSLKVSRSGIVSIFFF